MALGLSGSKGGISENERVDSEDSVDLFKDLVKLNNREINYGNRTFR